MKRRRLEEMNEQKKSRNIETSHSKPWHTDQAKQQETVNSPGTTRAGTREIIVMTGLVLKTGLAAKTDIITKTATRMAEERRGVEEKKFHSVTSMAEAKAIGQMNAPSPSKRKQSSSAKVPCQQRQSTTPRNDHNKLPFHLPHGP